MAQRGLKKRKGRYRHVMANRKITDRVQHTIRMRDNMQSKENINI